jgi:hypothetical protein
MAAANESQGLKIAVSAFLSLSVILSVALYFLYSAYSSAEARLDAALTQNQQLSKAQKLLQTQYDELKSQMSKLSDSRTK